MRYEPTYHATRRYAQHVHGVSDPGSAELTRAYEDCAHAFAEAHVARRFKDGFRIIRNHDDLHAIVSRDHRIITVIRPGTACHGCPCAACKPRRKAIRPPGLPRGRRKER